MTQTSVDQTPELKIYTDRLRCPTCGATRPFLDSYGAKRFCDGTASVGEGWSDVADCLQHQPIEMVAIQTIELSAAQDLRRADLDLVLYAIDEEDERAERFADSDQRGAEQDALYVVRSAVEELRTSIT